MKKKTLLITGRTAAEELRNFGNVVICPLDVASLLTPNLILKELRKKNLKGVSRIIVPGSILGDVSLITKKLGIPCFKGTKHFSDLPLILDSKVKLSSKIPADDLIAKEKKEKTEKLLEKFHKRKKGHMKIGNLTLDGAPYVIAEIVDAPKLSKKHLLERAEYYIKSGADVLDIGMISGEDNSKKINKIVRILRKFAIPLSVDTLNKNEILTATNSGVDLILSLDETNYQVAEKIKIPAVVIPRDRNGKVPKKPDEKIILLKKIIKKLKEETGFEKIIVDPILEPLNFGFTESLSAYIKFRNENPKVPMLMGVGNVTELFDADSIGINALLAGIASELKIDLIFTPEASVKSAGSVGELATAVKMLWLSKKQNQTPKDLGIDLLKLKDKRKIETITTPDEEKVKTVNVKEKRKFVLDDSHFKIFIKNKKIVVIFYHRKKPKLKFISNNATKLYREILSRIKIDTSHAAYLGRELMKAEIALKLGRNYAQDEDLF